MAIVKLRNVRLTFPDLWTPVQFQGQGKFRYNATFLVPKNSVHIKEIEAAIEQVAKEAYPSGKHTNFLAGVKGNSNKYCFLDGDIQDRDGYAGNMTLATHAEVRPRVCDRDPKVILEERDGRPYSGCYVNAEVDIWCQTKTYPGIRATLKGVQFYRDGDAFSAARPSAEDAFEDLSAEDIDDGADLT